MNQDFYFITGKLSQVTDKAIRIDDQWYPIFMLEYGAESFWKLGDIIEVYVKESFLVKNNII